jgi:hypothetical protein
MAESSANPSPPRVSSVVGSVRKRDEPINVRPATYMSVNTDVSPPNSMRLLEAT